MDWITRNKVLLNGNWSEIALYLDMLGNAGLLVTNTRWIGPDLYCTVQEVNVYS